MTLTLIRNYKTATTIDLTKEFSTPAAIPMCIFHSLVQMHAT
jgi:hypothetical protein